MEKDCIFKACKGKEWWYLYRYPNKKATNGSAYRVYNGRKWHEHMTWYTYEMALEWLLRECLGINDITINKIRI